MNTKGLSKAECNFLRGVAALFVIIAHYCQWYQVHTDAGFFCMLLSKLGRYGVSVFFALSGYGLMCSVKKGIDNGFLFRRLKNVYLPYLIVTGLIHMLDGTKWSGEFVFRWLLAVDSWFVMVIIIFYALFYFVWKYCKNKMMIMWLGILVISLLIGLCTKDSTWYSCNFSFGIGIFIKKYEFEFSDFVKKNHFWWFVIISVCFCASAVLYMTAMNKNQIVYICFKITASVLWTGLVLSVALFVKFRWGRVISSLGEASLECYLVHSFVISVIEEKLVFTKKIGYLGIYFISFLTSVIAAYLIHSIYNFLVLKLERGKA